jgi:hypothetical protein
MPSGTLIRLGSRAVYVLASSAWSTPLDEVVIDDTGVHRDPDLWKGLQFSKTERHLGEELLRFYAMQGLSGEWPDLRVDLNDMGARGGTTVTYRHDARSRGWTDKAVKPPPRRRAFAEKGPRHDKAPPPAGVTRCLWALDPLSFQAQTGLPGGERFELGRTCTKNDDGDQHHLAHGPAAVERWDARGGVGLVEPLPGLAGAHEMESGALVARSATDVDLWLTPSKGAYFAHFDGKAWTQVPGPTPASDDPVTEALFLPSGGVVAIVGERVYRSTQRGAWERMPLPPGNEGAPLAAVRLYATAGALYVHAKDKDEGQRLLSTVAPAEVFTPKDADAAPPESAPPRVLPATPSCKSPFVLLYTLARTAPPDFDFPLTRAGLKGHTELAGVEFAETEDRGKRYLVAFVKSYEGGRKMVEVVRASVKGSTPQLLCGEPPKKNRVLRIDLATGELRR